MRKKIIVALSVIMCVMCLFALAACASTDTQTPGGGGGTTPDQTEHKHDYVPTVTPAQCFAQGYTTYTCSCGASYVDDYTPALGHNMSGDACLRCGHGATQGLTYGSVSGGYYAVTGIGTATTNDLIIPSTYSGNAVVAIAENAFRGVDFIEYVMLPASVKKIGREAFYGCDRLKSVTLTAVEEIDTLALSSENINEIKLPETLKIIRSTAFGQLVMDKIEIPASVELIEECGFAFCEFDKITVAAGNARYKADGNCLIDTETQAIIAGCKGSVIPADGSVVKIADNAFHGLVGLDTLVIPDPITTIGLWAFSYSEIKSLKLGKGVNTITYGAFQGCEDLVTLTVDPENEKYTAVGNCLIEKEGKRLVLGCKGSVIPNDADVVTAIADNAFRECPLPSSFAIPSNITAIGLNAFKDSGLVSVTIGEGLTDVSGAFSGCSSLKNVTIADGVTAIAERMFGNSAIEHITLPESITEIGEGAFSSCSSLREIEIPSKVTVIPDSAFCDCISLTRVTIPNNIVTIGPSAFANCYNLVQVTLGTGVTEIGKSAFNACNKLTELVNLSSLDIQKLDASNVENFGNIGYSLATTKFQRAAIQCYFAGEIYTSTDYTSKLDFVDGFVFYNNEGSWELYGCNNVGDVTLPESYNGNDYDIAAGAFAYYTSATTVTVRSGVRSVKPYAFFNNKNVSAVDFNGVEEINYYVFQQCENLQSLTFDDCGAIAGYAVLYCNTIEEINLHNVGSVGGYAFYPNGASDVLTRIAITGTCDKIDTGAFYNFSNREAVVILSADIKEFAEYGFHTCGFDTVYFTGTSEQWAASAMSAVIGSVEVYCYSESRPADDGNYWHYAADGATPVKW